MALEPNVHWAGGNAPLPYWRRLNEAFTVYMRQWNLSVNAYAVLVLIYESGDGLEPARLAKMIGLKRAEQGAECLHARRGGPLPRVLVALR